MSSSPSSMLYRRATTSQARSFMINDILQSHVHSLEKRKMELQNFRSACPVEYIDADFLSSANRRSFLSGIPNSDEVKLSRYPSSVNPYAKLGFNFIPPNAGYFLSRAAEIMASNCVYPTLPVPLPMPPYDHLPVHRFLHFADGGVGSRKCRRSRTVFSELQLMALEERFERQKYLSTPDRMELAEALGLTQLQVKTWYQNRRMKWKKQVQHSDESPSASSDTNSSEAKSKFSANQSADSPPVVSPGCETTCSSKDMDALKDQKPFTGSRKGYVSPQPASQLPRATFPGFPSFPVSRNPSLSYRRDVSYDYGISHCDSTFEN